MTDKLARAKLARAARRIAAQSGSALPALVMMTDDRRGTDPVAAARALPGGSMIILRWRDPARRAELAKRLRAITRSRSIKLLIANDAALAEDVKADGVHLAEENISHAGLLRARRPRWLITASAHSLRAAMKACQADAIFLGPAFATQSHPGIKAMGLMQLRFIAQHCVKPIYALGGIDAVTAPRLEGAKLAGLAAIGALAI